MAISPRSAPLSYPDPAPASLFGECHLASTPARRQCTCSWRSHWGTTQQREVLTQELVGSDLYPFLQGFNHIIWDYFWKIIWQQYKKIMFSFSSKYFIFNNIELFYTLSQNWNSQYIQLTESSLPCHLRSVQTISWRPTTISIENRTTSWVSCFRFYFIYFLYIILVHYNNRTTHIISKY